MATVCRCGKGYASEVDNLCKFCREGLLRRAEAKSIGVRHAGDGLNLYDLQKYMAKKGVKYPVKQDSDK